MIPLGEHKSGWHVVRKGNPLIYIYIHVDI